MKTETNKPDAAASGVIDAGKRTAAPATIKRPRRMAREPDANLAPGAPPEPMIKPQAKSRGESKIAGVIALLKRDEGATLAQLAEATGWLAHTTRAALTGLRKKGHLIAKTSRGGRTVYRIEETA
jgi:hypothetical protein